MLVGDSRVYPSWGLSGQSFRLFPCQPQFQKDLEPEGQCLERPQGTCTAPSRESVIAGTLGPQGSWCGGNPTLSWKGLGAIPGSVSSARSLSLSPFETGCLWPSQAVSERSLYTPRHVLYHSSLCCNRMLQTFLENVLSSQRASPVLDQQS